MRVQLLTSETRADYNGNVEMFSQGFKDVFAQGFEVGYLLLVGSVVNVVLGSCIASCELLKSKMGG